MAVGLSVLSAQVGEGTAEAGAVVIASVVGAIAGRGSWATVAVAVAVLIAVVSSVVAVVAIVPRGREIAIVAAIVIPAGRGRLRVWGQQAAWRGRSRGLGGFW